MDLKWSDFLRKEAQSIVFGGGPPSGGKIGDPYELPRQNPIKTLGQLGDALRGGVRELGSLIAPKLGYKPETGANVFDLGSYLIPVFGMSRGIADTASSVSKGNYVNALWNIASTKPLVQRLVPSAVHLGYAGVLGAISGSRYAKRGFRQLMNYLK